jgi:ABC-type Mn2+/Zn2+ transport system permease subunit
MTRLVPISAGVAALAAVGGTLASVQVADLPTGAATVLAAALLFTVALGVRQIRTMRALVREPAG